MSEEVLYEKLIHENMDKGYQVRLVVNVFREVEYLHIRKYFLSYEGDWVPSKEGISIPAAIENIYALLDGLMEICAAEESTEVINTHFKERLDEQNSRVPKPSEP